MSAFCFIVIRKFEKSQTSSRTKVTGQGQGHFERFQEVYYFLLWTGFIFLLILYFSIKL